VTSENDDRRVVARKLITATREQLFDAWTDPDSMRHWMCPGDTISADVTIDARVGGSFVIVMRGPTHSYEHRGTFKLIDRPSKLVFTWSSKATNWEDTLVTVEFIAKTERETELVLTHEELPTRAIADQHHAGWSQIITQLGEYLHSQG